MGQLDDVTLQGLLIHDTRLTFANRLVADIVVTEASPVPGSSLAADPLSDAVPRISGAQGASVDIQITRAGFGSVDPDRGMRAAYKLDSEAVAEWRGWNTPGWLNRYDVISAWSTASVYHHMDCVVIPSTQRVVAGYSRFVGASDVYTRTLDPNTWTWAGLVTTTGLSGGVADIAMCVLPSERVLLMWAAKTGSSAWKVISSTDAGATWADYSLEPFGVLGTTGVIGAIANTSTDSRMTATADGSVIFVRTVTNAGTRNMAQYASGSLGGRFTLVGSEWTASAPDSSMPLWTYKSGKIGCAYILGGVVYSKTIGSAWASIEDASAVTVASALTGTSANISAHVDSDGVAYVMIDDARNTEVYVSYDEGSTWAPIDATTSSGLWDSSDGATQILPRASCSTSGAMVLLANSASGAGTNPDGAVHSLICGGWGNVENVQAGWSGVAVYSGAYTYLPIENPATIAAWTTIGTGTDVLTTPGMLRVTTAASRRYFSDSGALGTSVRDMVFFLDVEVQSGGSVTSADVGLRVGYGDGANTTTFEVCVTPTQYSIYDISGAATIGSVVTHNVPGRLQVLIYIDYNSGAPLVYSWHRADTGHNWTAAHSGDSIGAFGAGTSGTLVYWGQPSSATAQSDWYQFHWAWSTTSLTISPRYLLTGSNPLNGRQFTAEPYPVVGAGTAAQSAFLSIVDGPAYRGETFDLDAAHSYAVERMYSEVSPSPRDEWRSTVMTATKPVAWQPAGAGFVTSLGNSSIALYVGRTNCREIILESLSGTSYATVGILDLSLPTVSYVLTGDSITADTAGAGGNVGRYLWEGELVGGWVSIGGKPRKIRKQTAGVFNADAATTTRQATIWLDGIDGTELSNDTCIIYHHSGVLIVHNVTPSSKYRLRIASSSNADGYFAIGAHLLGGFMPFGRHGSRGYQWGKDLNAQTSRSASGTTRVRESGDAPRSLSLTFADRVDLTGIRNNDPDYLQAGAGGPLASSGDVPFLIEGFISETKSGEIPVVALLKVSDSDETITDPTLYLYGRISSSASAQHVLGSEGVDELFRPAQMTISEIV